jgi:hypothetical protein
MEGSFASFVDRFAEASSKRAKMAPPEPVEEVVRAPPAAFSALPVPPPAPLPAAFTAPVSCCAVGVGAYACSACGAKTYCSVLCKIQDMVAHRRECSGATEMQHVYAFCGAMSETERVALLKSQPKDAAKDRFIAPAPPQRSNASSAPALNKIDVVAVVEQLMKLPEAHFFTDLPNSVVFPKYYTVVAEPISLKQMLRVATRGKYPTLASLTRDLDVMASNAAAFNGSRSHVARQARFLAAEGRRLLQERHCGDCACRLVGLKQNRTCENCAIRRCAKCPPCPCSRQLGFQSVKGRIESNGFAAGSGAELSAEEIQLAIASLPAEDTGVLAQMLSEEQPRVMDCDVADDISVELTPELCARIKYLLI